MLRNAKMHRNTDEEKGSGAATEVLEVKTFDQLSDDELNTAVNGAMKPEDPEEKENKQDENPAEEKEEGEDEQEENESGDPQEKNEVPDEKKKTEKAEKKQDDDELDKLPEYKLTKLDDKGNETEEESTWETIAELASVPLEVEKGKPATHEDFIKGVNNRVAAEVAKVENKNFTNYLETFTPAAQLVIKALASDPKMDIGDVLNPAKDFDEVLAQDDEALVRNSMELVDKLAKPEIDEEIERLKDEGRLTLEAKKIRNVVTGNRNRAIENFLTEKSAVYDAAIKRRNDLEKEENTAMNKIINDTNEFFGGKIPDDIKKMIKEKHNSGHYKKLFSSDLKSAYQAILSIELGEQAKTRLLGKGKSQGVRKTTETLLNKTVPTKTGSGAVKKENKGEEEGTDTFDAWDAINTQKVGVVRGNG